MGKLGLCLIGMGKKKVEVFEWPCSISLLLSCVMSPAKRERRCDWVGVC
jgi:hypothetical protein